MDVIKNILYGLLGLIGLTILYFVIPFGLTWLVVCAFVWAICLCFGFTFSWLAATGVWLILILIGMFFGQGSQK